MHVMKTFTTLLLFITFNINICNLRQREIHTHNNILQHLRMHDISIHGLQYRKIPSVPHSIRSCRVVDNVCRRHNINIHICSFVSDDIIHFDYGIHTYFRDRTINPPSNRSSFVLFTTLSIRRCAT